MQKSEAEGRTMVVSYGAGRDSTAMLIRMAQLGIRPSAITTADVGSEKRDTYAFLPVFNRWLKAHGMPPITMVRLQPKKAPYHTIEGNMIRNATMPGVAYNKHTCSMKWKIEPQQKWARHWQPAKDAWARGEQVLRLIGFEAGEEQRLNRADSKAHALSYDPEKAKYEVRYPLMEWGIDVNRCIEIIQEAGLPVPPKSSCFMCPIMKPWEVQQELTNDERGRAMLIELTAEPYNTKAEGLWRKGPKGLPGSMTQWILEQGLPFTELTQFGSKVVLNPASGKVNEPIPDPREPSLRTMMQEYGHAVPRLVRPDEVDENDTDVYRDVHPSERLEDEAHAQLVEELFGE